MKKPFFEASLYSIRNRSGFGADITDLGGAVVSLLVPDRGGRLIDVALGWRDPAEYLNNPGCLGELVGRVANRIGGAKFTLDGVEYRLRPNENGNLLHGGMVWFRRFWRAELVDAATLRLHLTSPDGEYGFPGRVEVTVTYRVTDDNCFEIDYLAEPDRPTLINLTNHTYFNLNGEATADTADHQVISRARRITAVDSDLIPTGEVRSTAGTPYDLSCWRSFSELRNALPRGYDCNVVVGDEDETFKPDVITVRSPRTGIVLSVSTTAPGVQFYMGGMMIDPPQGKAGAYGPYAGFCLETQHWPDAPHHAGFPSIRFTPEHPYRQRSVYRFGIEQ